MAKSKKPTGVSQMEIGQVPPPPKPTAEELKRLQVAEYEKKAAVYNSPGGMPKIITEFIAIAKEVMGYELLAKYEMQERQEGTVMVTRTGFVWRGRAGISFCKQQ